MKFEDANRYLFQSLKFLSFTSNSESSWSRNITADAAVFSLLFQSYICEHQPV